MADHHQLHVPFATLLKLLSPDFATHDTTLYWTCRVAAKLGIPAVNFTVTNMTSTSFIIGQHRHGLPEIPTAVDICAPPFGFPSLVVRNRLFEARNTLPFYQNKKHAISDGLSFLDRLCVSVEESWAMCFLDALLLGLEESEIPFLCVLTGHAASELPQDFEDRTHGRRSVVTEWAPQLHILNHPSTGAFLSHCGWNSVTEGLRFGMPFVALPIQYEQGLIARLIADELKIGVEVRRNEEDGSFSKEDITRAVRALMVEEEGNRIKSIVEEVSGVLTNNDSQVHRTNTHNFVSALKEKASSKRTV
ncbi:hypothetical protein SUGI_1128620 [Cryptomeria japonica]|nr:hypothetical protein SUGI_1128620 [Cryptomeria japonica]